MTNIEEIRNIIDDHIRIGYSSEVSTGQLQVYQLNTRNFWNLVIRDSQDAVVEQTGLTLYPQSGQIKGILPVGDVTFEYDQAGFTDAEIQTYLTKYENSVNRTALALVELLIASAAKRFDYKAGIKDIKASQVFAQLRELRTQLLEAVEVEQGGAELSGGIFVDRSHPADRAPTTTPSWSGDITRIDG